MQQVTSPAEWFTVRWLDERLVIIDQRKLPEEEVYLSLDDLEDVFTAIRMLMVRGAPAIGIVAAWGMVVAAQGMSVTTIEQLLKGLEEAGRYLISARPTAVNLSWAVNRMLGAAREDGQQPSATIHSVIDRLHREAQAIQSEDEAASYAIGVHLLDLLGDSRNILTHCNAGQLATSRYGTALAPLYVGVERGMKFHVFVDETRPVLQGARLTAWELQRLGVEATLICDNMAASVMSAGKVNAVIVGADRITANGDVANKIGTLNVAILADHFHVPFYVAAPLSTIDLSIATGDEIPIEIRDKEEIISGMGRVIAPRDIDVYNPAFDVTPNEYVTAIVTEKGAALQPFTQSLREQFG